MVCAADCSELCAISPENILSVLDGDGGAARELGRVEARVGTVRRDELIVAALLDDVAVLHHQDGVGVADRGQAVGDDEARAALAQRVHRLLDQQLRAGIHRAGGLIEDEHCRVGHEGPRDREQLALSGGDVRGVLLQNRVVALRQGLDDVVDEARPRGGLDLLITGPGPPVADVLADRAREQPRVLQDHAGPATHVVTRHRGDIAPVDEDASPIELVEAHEQVDQRGLARPRGPHDRNRVPGVHPQRQIPDELDLRVVGEAHMLHLDDARPRRPLP